MSTLSELSKFVSDIASEEDVTTMSSGMLLLWSIDIQATAREIMEAL